MSHNHTILGQMLQMISRFEFQKAVNETKTEYHARGFRSWNHFIAMLFGQLSGQDSLRGIEAREMFTHYTPTGSLHTPLANERPAFQHIGLQHELIVAGCPIFRCGSLHVYAHSNSTIHPSGGPLGGPDHLFCNIQYNHAQP